MLAKVERGRSVGVIIHKIDRSARNLKDWARLGDLIDRGVEVHFAHESLDMRTRGGRLAADLQAVVAADFIRNLRDEVKKGIRGRLRQGYFPRAAPVGYRDNGAGKPKTIDPIKGPLVRTAFALYATGNFSLHGLRAEMAKRGLATRSGRALPLGNFARLLHNPFYIGIIRWPATGEEFQGNHEPLIPLAVFKRVQAVSTGRLYPRVQTHAFRFRRLIKCGTCARTLTGERQRGHVYYRCHAHECRGTSVSEKQVEKTLGQELSRLALHGGDPDNVDVVDLRRRLARLVEEERGTVDEGRQALLRDLANAEERFARVTDAFLDSDLDREVYTTRKAEYLRRRAELNDALATPISTKWRDIAERFERGLAAKTLFDGAEEADLRELLSEVSSNISVRQKRIEFPMRQPFAAMREFANSNLSEANQDAVRTFMAEIDAGR